jgi:glutamine cyclotransferase
VEDNKKRRSPIRKIPALIGIAALAGLSYFYWQVVEARAPSKKTPVLAYTVVNAFPHDPQAFTQGLIFLEGFLYESTGLQGRSSLRKVDLETGRILKQADLPGHLFGEGLTHWKDRLVQLTWRSGLGLVYSRETFRLLKKFNYTTEGWGLTQDGRHLIMSDGTAMLYFLDPETFREVRRLEVRDGDQPLRGLNELEYFNNEIYANVFLTDRIARISPMTGKVKAWIDLQGLLSPKELTRPVDVLNGIAYDSAGHRLFVTGKLWPRLFEIKLADLHQARQQPGRH